MVGLVGARIIQNREKRIRLASLVLLARPFRLRAWSILKRWGYPSSKIQGRVTLLAKLQWANKVLNSIWTQFQVVRKSEEIQIKAKRPKPRAKIALPIRLSGPKNGWFIRAKDLLCRVWWSRVDIRNVCRKAVEVAIPPIRRSRGTRRARSEKCRRATETCLIDKAMEIEEWQTHWLQTIW